VTPPIISFTGRPSSTADTLRLNLRRKLGVSPLAYRRRFALTG
jgi:hypothetical protein